MKHKRIAAILLSAALILSLAACGTGGEVPSGSQDTPAASQDAGGTEATTTGTASIFPDDPYFYINGKSPDEVTGTFSFWDWDDKDYSFLTEYLLPVYPNVEIDFTNVAYNDYLMKITSAIASGSEVPDIMAMDVRFLGKFYSLGIVDSLEGAPFEVDPGTLVDFTANIATDSDGTLRSMPNIAPAGAMFYKRELAKEYLGTDDPDEVGKMVATWDDFVAVGEGILEKSGGSVYMIGGVDSLTGPLSRQIYDPWVDEDSGQLYTDGLFLEAFQIMEKIQSAGISAGLKNETPAYFASIPEDDVFCYVGAMFFQNWVIKPNDPEGAGRWAVCDAPGKPYTYGGIYFGVYDKSPNKEAAATFFKFHGSAYGAKAKWDYLDFYPPVKAAYEEDYISEGDPYYGGQNTTPLYLKVFDEMTVPACQVEDGLMMDSFQYGAESIAQGLATPEEALQKMTDDIIAKQPKYHR